MLGEMDPEIWQAEGGGVNVIQKITWYVVLTVCLSLLFFAWDGWYQARYVAKPVVETVKYECMPIRPYKEKAK